MSTLLPKVGESTTSTANSEARRPRRRISKKTGRRVAVTAIMVATTAVSLSSCAPTNKVWYPLGRPAMMISRGYASYHSGIDMVTPTGTPVIAATNGVVTQAGWYYGYGNYVCITRDAGFRSCYGHLSYIYAHPGLVVRAGQTIGLSGSTGNSTGPHLHFEIYRNGYAVNPAPYM